ncbi:MULTISPECIES: sodium/solute symporter [Streptomyces]|uniref:Cation/acetate symporter ActP n=4 Tax=Streptomyces TaxID=1883 RepID=A0A1D8GA66_9ACTN|nr:MULTISPECIES: cation acetate symporter [Streptomyces]AOT62318.1 Cation/acetate symporter ActP [Streptomyces rubrolavendulae]KAF0650778.1 sodium:solute symporter [Streptomyces fradiae ATCC 10745 = DSM 40063]OSY53407.1 Cation/acetate symporter ActP [Streptomyces fradiae ATCC 10745 = DSM 40063]QEV15136.1 cation acetate symporter [Streptomyces fradiae ATCC 10745 = DSM 40063]
MNQTYAMAAVAAVVAATVLIGSLGLRVSRTTSDFYVASRSVKPGLNAAAISGEYLSAASFLGVAGLVLLQGPAMLWYPVGYTAGYLVLLVLVAAPLRRSGAYTLSDFAEARLESPHVRRLASLLVVGIGWLYLLPQLQGAGLTLEILTGAPEWFGGLLVAAVVTAAVAAGGMRSVTFVQAFQYWLKLTALLVPALFLVAAWTADDAPRARFDAPAAFREHTSVRVDETVRLDLDAPLALTVTGTVDGAPYSGTRTTLGEGLHRVEAGTVLGFPAGARVPERAPDPDDPLGWSGALSGGGPDGQRLYATYGLILATFLGTMGLPHVAVRFYTSPDGRAARRTTLVVLGLVGAFYLLPPLYGALGRIYAPELALTGDADAAVLVLPDRLVGGTTGDLLGALVAGGAFAAFLSTASGLTMSVAGVLSQDVLPSRGVRPFRLATLLAMGVPLALSVVARNVPVADAVGLAFAVSASSFCPLLVLGIWWRRLTPPGAVAGLLAGGGAALTAVMATRAGLAPDGWPHTLMAWPAVWSVPLGFLTMAGVSLATPRRVPPHALATLARLHLPEGLLGRPRTEAADR